MRAGRFIRQPLTLPNELWKPIKGFTGYEVSNFGRIRNGGTRIDGRTKISRIMSPSKSGNVTLRRLNKSYSFKIAQLLLRTFVGPPPKNKTLARHLNDNIDDCHLSNLDWGDHQDNYNDGVRNGRHGPDTPGARIRGKKLKGKERPQWVKDKISQTKKAFPERQFYGRKHGTDGRFL